MTTVNIDANYPTGDPHAFGTALITLFADETGTVGGTYAGEVIGGHWRDRLDEDGHTAIDLPPNANIVPAGSYYRIEVDEIYRTIIVPTVGPVNWADAAIQVVAPAPPGWVPLVGPAGPAGPAGAAGQAGDPDDLGFEVEIAPASTTWVMPHPFTWSPNVTLLTSAGDEFTADNINHAPGVVTATMAAPVAGKGILS